MKYYPIGRLVWLILLISMLTGGFSASTCSSGCLSCEQIGFDEPKCTMCDPISGYYMERGRCIKSTKHACSLLTFDSQCNACAENHYYDFSVQDCKLVPDSNIIEFCQYYKGLNSCLACIPGYYYSASDGKCLRADPPIENCEYYFSSERCMRCSPDYWASYDRSACYAIDSENCLIASSLRCGFCADNYFMSQNYALTNRAQSISQIMLSKFLSFEKIPYMPLEQSSCIRKLDENCEEFLDAITCTRCKTGYFLYEVDKRCYEKPSVSIPNCQFYSDLTTCSECLDGFYRETTSKCVKNEVLPNCVTYANDRTTTFCKLCDEG